MLVTAHFHSESIDSRSTGNIVVYWRQEMKSRTASIAAWGHLNISGQWVVVWNFFQTVPPPPPRLSPAAELPMKYLKSYKHPSTRWTNIHLRRDSPKRKGTQYPRFIQGLKAAMAQCGVGLSLERNASSFVWLSLPHYLWQVQHSHFPSRIIPNQERNC